MQHRLFVRLAPAAVVIVIWGASSCAHAQDTPANLRASEEAVEAATEEPEALDGRLPLHPFLVLVGGINYDQIINRPAEAGTAEDERQSRLTTLAMTRFGLEGRFGEHVSVRSELELSAGPHGSSVWEGQAALTVRDQYIRLEYEPLQLDVGRITDPASIDYYSAHVANTLLTDPQIRLPFLASGANRGNGILARYRLFERLVLGATLNAGNPVSFTGTASLGGTYPPFSRFYYNIVGSVRESATRFPSDLFYAVLVSPSVSWEGDLVRAQVGYQYVYVDVTTADRDNPGIQAHNVRGGVQGLFLDGSLRPFVNASFIRNQVIGSQGSLPDTSRLAPELFRGLTFGAGIDWDVLDRTGVGAQYNLVHEQQGEGAVTSTHFVNVGASWWFHPQVAAEIRYGAMLRCQDGGGGCETTDNQHLYYLTLRGVFGGAPAREAQSF